MSKEEYRERLEREGRIIDARNRRYLAYAGAAVLAGFLVWKACSPSPPPPVATTVPQVTLDYNPGRVCPNAWDQDAKGELDHRDDDRPYFDVILKPGCFSGWFRPPKAWGAWQEEFISDEPGRYVAYWFFGASRARGPYGPNNIPGDYHSNQWRYQGVGKLRIFKTVQR
jgi:hypothetical protein